MTRIPDGQLPRLCDALAEAAKADGLPCGISPSDLHQRFGGPTPIDTGALLHHRWRELAEHCATRGITLASYTRHRPGHPGRIEMRTPAPDTRQGSLL